MAIKKKVAALVLLAAFEFSKGRKQNASKLLTKAAEDEDFDETMEGMGEAITEDDEVLSADDDAFTDDPDVDGDDDEDDDEMAVASLLRTRRSVKRRVKAADSLDDGDSPGDTENDNDEERRPVNEEARTRRMKSNLKALAGLK